MGTLLFTTQHDKNTLVRIIYGRSPDGGVGLDIVLNGRVSERVFNPTEVTQWFEQNSKANVKKWKDAFHEAGAGLTFVRPQPEVKDITLKVPYHSQRDNERYPGGSCNVTSYAMAMTYHGCKQRRKDSFRQFEDELEHFLQSHGRDRHVHEDLAWMARQYGLDAQFRTDLTLDEIRQEIRIGNPVVTSTVLTKAGHIICLIGTKGQDFIANDPYGNYNNGYSNDHNGAKVVYSEKLMKAKMRAPGGNLKWGHILRKKS